MPPIADRDLGQGIRVVPVSVRAFRQLEDGGEDVLVILTQRELVRIIFPGPLKASLPVVEG
eukprot:9468300-Pyramimonas_sp.AAC.1